ncbi:3'-5' exoribonuclease domain-containing protein [Iningainema tapete]|uniref:3'-5' exoribonuclease n=1 Tax=Iningainema tapete BLCC-T55 TaxID=2748662 RepID=A0A8J6XJ07_9CYAN|nr:3'-5' exoribonuclease [Iningainema tapete]MBD2771142.1 3'-5' exoribonuclease [Iningainema tapete BLCC-T55]
MRYWMDLEFIENGKTIDIISIGVVCEDGREYYAISYDCDWSKASDWVKQNVLPKLPKRPNLFNLNWKEVRKQGWRSRADIAFEVLKFIKYPVVERDIESYSYHELKSLETPITPEVWAYYADYDWVAFCQLFGTMSDLPKGLPMYCRDIKQYCDYLGNPRLPSQGKGEHNALLDARWNKQAWEFLRRFEEDCVVSRV